MEQTVESTPDPFDASLEVWSNTPEPVAEEPAAPETTERPSRARDEHGKFTKAAESVDYDDKAEKPEAPKTEQKAEEVAPVKPKRNDPQARIDELTRLRREAERRAEDAERRYREMEERSRVAQPAQPKPEAPKPEKFPSLADWSAAHPDGSLEEWIDARDEWRDEQRQKQAHAEARDRTLREQAQTYGSRLLKAREADPDIKLKIAPELLNAEPVSALGPDAKPQFANLAAEVGFNSDDPAALYVHLSANGGAEATRIVRSVHPSQWMAALLRLDGQLSGASSRRSSESAAANPGPAPTRVPSAAKAPISPVRTSPHSADDDDGSDDEPIEAHIRRENARDRKSGRL